MDLVTLLVLAETSSLSFADLQAFASAKRFSLQECSDFIAIHVAREFASGRLSYRQGDNIMNALWGLAMSDEYWKATDREVPPLLTDVYLAFDEGEYQHSGDSAAEDAEVKYTKPLIAEVLERFGARPNDCIREKNERAAQPWLPVAPDPPEPK